MTLTLRNFVQEKIFVSSRFCAASRESSPLRVGRIWIVLRGGLEVVGDGAKVGGANGLGVFGEDAAGVFGLGHFPPGKAGLDFGVGKFEIEGWGFLRDGFEGRKGIAGGRNFLTFFELSFKVAVWKVFMRRGGLSMFYRLNRRPGGSLCLRGLLGARMMLAILSFIGIGIVLFS